MPSVEPGDIIVKITALLLVAAAAAHLSRRASASVRHLVWMSGLAGAILLPLLALLLPAWQILPSLTAASAGSAFVVDDGSGSTNGVIGMTVVAGLWRLWLAGAALLTGWMVLGDLRLHARIRRTGCEPSRAWCDAITASRAEATGIRFVESAEVAMPCAWGVVRPVVLLPAFGEWSAVDRRCAVLHEVAHIRRGDLVAHRIARLACVLHWYHPLVWMAARSAKAVREMACDDVVVTHDVPTSEYATMLLALGTRGDSNLAGADAVLGLADRSDLTTRLLSLLDATRNRTAPSQRALFLAALPLLVLIGVVASVAPAQQAVTAKPGATASVAAMTGIAKRVCGTPAKTPGPASFSVSLRDSTGAVRQYTLRVNCVGGSPQP